MSKNTLDHPSYNLHEASAPAEPPTAERYRPPVLIRFPDLSASMGNGWQLPNNQPQPTWGHRLQQWGQKTGEFVVEHRDAIYETCCNCWGHLSAYWKKPAVETKLAEQNQLAPSVPANKPEPKNWPAWTSAFREVAVFAFKTWFLHRLVKLPATVIVGSLLTATVAGYLTLSGSSEDQTKLAEEKPPAVEAYSPILAPIATAVEPSSSDGNTPAPTEVALPRDVPSWNPQRGLTAPADAWSNRPVELASHRMPYNGPDGNTQHVTMPAIPGVARLKGRIEPLVPTVGTRNDAHRPGFH